MKQINPIDRSTLALRVKRSPEEKAVENTERNVLRRTMNHWELDEAAAVFIEHDLRHAERENNLGVWMREADKKRIKKLKKQRKKLRKKLKKEKQGGEKEKEVEEAQVIL